MYIIEALMAFVWCLVNCGRHILLVHTHILKSTSLKLSDMGVGGDDFVDQMNIERIGFLHNSNRLSI